MMNVRPIFVLSGWLLLAITPAMAQTSHTAFDAAVAWKSFSTLLRQQYGYFDQSGVDGNAILTTFAARANAARSDTDFIHTLQLVSHNFADPHFIVGPSDPDSWEIVPTASDLFGILDDGIFRVGEVRAKSDASAKGVRPGMTVILINGKSPEATIEEITGRPFAALTPAQSRFAFDIALAGRRDRPRALTLADGNDRHTFTLDPTAIQAKRVEDGPLLEIERQGALGIIRINNSLGNQGLIPRFAEALASLAGTTTLLIDLRNTPSGGNTSVARGIMGHFVDFDRPYQMHVVPYEARVLGPTRKFVEYVAPYGQRYTGKVYVAGGHWTGSMGEGMMIGFEAFGITTIGSDLGHLLGATENETIDGSTARIDLGTEQLFTVTGLPRAAFRPQHYLAHSECDGTHDPVLDSIGSKTESPTTSDKSH